MGGRGAWGCGPRPGGAWAGAHDRGFARRLASPIGVLITIPALVVAVGVGILLVGRNATRSASDQMARRQLTTQASSVTSDVAFALDQAGPVLERLRTLADPARPADEVLVRDGRATAVSSSSWRHAAGSWSRG